MKWPIDLTQLQLQATKTQSVFVLLIAVTILNLFTLYYNADNKTDLLQITAADTRSVIQLKQMNNALRQITQQLQQSKALSEISAKTVVSELNAIQAVLNKSPSQTYFTQLQASITQINQRIIKENVLTETNHHEHISKIKHRHLHHLSSKTLPFKVMGIDIWNDITQVTVNFDGAPELMAKGDTYFGWTLKAASFDLGMAIFENRHGQTVTLHL